MAAMMLPSALPMVLAFVDAVPAQGQPARSRQFVAAYLLAWAGLQRRGNRGAMAAAGLRLGRPDDRQPLGAAVVAPAAGGRRVPVLAAQARLPCALPHADGLPHRRMAAGRLGGLRDGLAARPVLPGLLLGADGAAVRRRRDEHRLGRRAGARGGDREDGAAAASGSPACSASCSFSPACLSKLCWLLVDTGRGAPHHVLPFRGLKEVKPCHCASTTPPPTSPAETTQGPIKLPRVDRRQLGDPVLAPEGLHAGVHHRAGLHGEDRAGVHASATPS